VEESFNCSPELKLLMN